MIRWFNYLLHKLETVAGDIADVYVTSSQELDTNVNAQKNYTNRELCLMEHKGKVSVNKVSVNKVSVNK